MTRQDFELIADVLKAQRNTSMPGPIHALVCAAFADRLQLTNSRFNRAQFLKACGVEVRA